jgi:hypothetical protein
MTNNTPRELLEKGLITPEQFTKIDLITSGKVVSVFYELRTLLYLGILLLTTGLGILIYENIGDLGHIAAIGLLALLTVACFVYVNRNAPPYSNESVKGPTPYYDYIVLLGALLFISVLGYLQYQYEIFDNAMGLTTLITALFFFFVAYRFDHAGVLSLAITALASFWSISISPTKWYSGDFFSSDTLHATGLIFSGAVAAVALFLDRKKIKTHFTFTYINFCCLIFFVSALVGLFSYNYYSDGPDTRLLYVLLILGGAAFAWYMARYKKSFLFLLYAFIATYIAFTYVLAEFVFDDIVGWFMYSIASCGGFIYFIIKFRNYFTRTS